MDEQIKQEIHRGELEPAITKFQEDAARAERHGDHYWIATAVHRMSGEALARNVNSGGADPLLLDRENLIEVMTGCYICEEPFAPRLVTRRYKGQPK